MRAAIDPMVGDHRTGLPVRALDVLHAEMAPDLHPAGTDLDRSPGNMQAASTSRTAIAVPVARQVSTR